MRWVDQEGGGQQFRSLAQLNLIHIDSPEGFPTTGLFAQDESTVCVSPRFCATLKLAALICRIADALGAAESPVAAYLGHASGPLPQADFKAVTMPDAAGEQKDFTRAVAEDQTLTAKQKEELLRLV